MEDIHQEPRGMAKLDLEKYGLSYLQTKHSQAWTDSDIEKFIDAFASENIAPTVLGLSFTPDNVNPLLSKSYCRRCGECCLPNPLDPQHPGVMVFEEELRLIAKYSSYSYKYLKKKAKINTDPNLARRRYLPLPCIFYQKGKCQIYDIRPLVCRTYPITDIRGQDGISINVRCDYGKDLYKSIIKHPKTRSQIL